MIEHNKSRYRQRVRTGTGLFGKAVLKEAIDVLPQLPQIRKNLSMKRMLKSDCLSTLVIIIVLLLATSAIADGTLPEKVPVLGGSKAFMPSFVTAGMFCSSILIGLVAGLITGVIGAGGGYVLTPALMSFGIRGIMTVGTDQFHLFAKAIMGTTIHKKLGNVNFALAVWFVAGSVLGVTFGGKLNRLIFQYSPAVSDIVITCVYVVVLGILGLYCVADWLSSRKKVAQGIPAGTITPFAKMIQNILIPPVVKFDEDIVKGGRRISAFALVICGFLVGFVAAIMGVGGGFLTFPIFVYCLGISTFTTVGTDILQIIFTTCYSSIFQYAVYGFIFFTVAIGMLLGSLIGIQIGAIVTTFVKGMVIRVLFALTILAGFSNRLCALPRKLSDLGYISLPRNIAVIIESVGTVIFFGLMAVFAVWTIIIFIRNIGKIRGADKKIIVDPRKFYTGLTGLLTFLLVLAFILMPVFNGKNLLVWADNFFNQIAKQSTYYIPEGEKKAGKFVQSMIDIGISPREFVETDKLILVLRQNQIDCELTADKRVRIKSSLGQIAKYAMEDAKVTYFNYDRQLENKYGITAKEIIYSWWIIFDGLARRFIQENHAGEASFAKFVSSKILEPSYNFYGITARKASQSILPLSLLLGFYILYTIWYGFSIMYLFEGLGITANNKSCKEEV